MCASFFDIKRSVHLSKTFVAQRILVDSYSVIPQIFFYEEL